MSIIYATSTAIVALIVIAFILAKSIRIVPQAMTMVIERLGKYHKTLRSGINFILPFFDSPRSVVWDFPVNEELKTSKRSSWIDLREQV